MISCNCIYNFFNGIWEFIDSNFFQTFILVITAFLTWYIYNKQNLQRKKDAATIIYLQVKEIKNKMKLAQECIGESANFSTTNVLKLNTVINNNLWEKYRQLLIDVLETNDIKALNEYYDLATTIDIQISVLRKAIFSINEAFYINEMTTEKLSQEKNPHIRVSMEHLSILREQCKLIDKYYEKLPHEKLQNAIYGNKQHS